MKSSTETVLAIVVPCFNEEEALGITIEELTKFLARLIKQEKISHKSYLLFVDDGSLDTTWEKLVTHSEKNQYVKALKLSRNFGHQCALLAGLNKVNNRCDCCISIDADLQDEIEAIEKMIDLFHQGNEVVYGVRNNRETDTFIKRFTAQSFYKLMKLIGVNIVYNHADYRLLSNRALTTLLTFKEKNLFLRGLIPMLGFKSDIVKYSRHKRCAGEKKYTYFMSLSLALNGLTSLNVVLLRLITYFGLIIFLASIVGGMIICYLALFTDKTITGWSSIMFSIHLLGGVLMLSLGIIGEYIGKIYNEVKRRPLFIEEKEIF